MKRKFLLTVAVATLAANGMRAQATHEMPSPPITSFIAVQNDVKLEVLDWGGSGRPLVLLAGMGDTAHAFDRFAPKLTPKYRVYGITRRGFGASSVPEASASNYSAERLGDDVLEVIDSLKLNRPVLVGHSLAGEELSSIGSRYPNKVAGLIYLEAGYSYAYYDRSQGDLMLDSLDLRKKLEGMIDGSGQDQKQLAQQLLQTDLPQFEKELQEMEKEQQLMPAQMQRPPEAPPVVRAIMSGEQKFTEIRVPILAIFAIPHSDLSRMFKDDPAALAAAEAKDAAHTEAQAKAFETGLPSARVVRLRNASHFVFRSNEDDVLREMNTFLAGLPQD